MRTPYEHVTMMDRKFEDFFSSPPFFFRPDTESRQKSRAIESFYPKIPLLRYRITTSTHSRRWRLHQKFLLRKSFDPRYAYSRKACLDSARAVIQSLQDGMGAGDAFYMARMGIVVHFTHLALVVMVMDLCFNRDESDQAEIKGEVKVALQILENAKEVSSFLNRSLIILH